jgi:hypothetical protein
LPFTIDDEYSRHAITLNTHNEAGLGSARGFGFPDYFDRDFTPVIVDHDLVPIVKVEGISDFAWQVQFVTSNNQDLNFLGTVFDAYILFRGCIGSHSVETRRGREECLFLFVILAWDFAFIWGRRPAGFDYLHLFPELNALSAVKWFLPSYDGNSVIRTARSPTMENIAKFAI